MLPETISRRLWIAAGLAGCAYLAASRGLGAADHPEPSGYTKPEPMNKRGLAPGLQSRVVNTSANGEKTYAVIFARGDEVLSGLTEFAGREGIKAGQITALGGFRHALFAWFDEEKKEFRNIPVNEQVEVCSLVGDIGLADGKPQVHIHGVVAFPTGETRGGHILEAYVGPTLEVIVTTWPDALVKKKEESTGLSLFDLNARA